MRGRPTWPASSRRARCCSDVTPLTLKEALAVSAGDRSEKTWSQTLGVDVDRERARFGSWYELFPRSWGGFEGVEEVLPELAELGFDVVYLPPIHPIGLTNRKGRNNAREGRGGRRRQPVGDRRARRAGTPRSTPSSARCDDFERLVARGAQARLRDRARLRDQVLARPPVAGGAPRVVPPPPDGTLKYAENPPKRYQDIYNFNFETRRLAGALERAARRDAPLGRARRASLPRRQPAHEAARRSGSG